MFQMLENKEENEKNAVTVICGDQVDAAMGLNCVDECALMHTAGTTIIHSAIIHSCTTASSVIIVRMKRSRSVNIGRPAFTLQHNMKKCQTDLINPSKQVPKRQSTAQLHRDDL